MRKRISRQDKRKIDYLFMLSRRYDLSFEKLMDAIVGAEDRGKSKCGDLDIERRTRTEEGSIFLIESDEELLTQIRLEEELFERLTHGELSYKPQVSRQEKENRNRDKDNLNISDLRVGMKRVLLEGEVTDKSPSRKVNSRFSNAPLDVATITVEDKTGSIRMSLWNEQIDLVSVGDKIRVDNARVGTYGGKKQLYMNRRYSTLDVLE